MTGGRRYSRWARAGVLLVLIAIAIVVALLVSGGSQPRKPAVPAPPGPRAQPAPGGQEQGANVNRVFEDPQLARQAAAQLSALQATGAALARTDALWEAAEPHAPAHGQHHYDWAFDDLIAAALAQHGLRWLPVIDYSPGWAQSVPGQDHSPPASDADYAAYAGAFAARYGPGGAFWSAHASLRALPVQEIEIWNEPDNPVFWVPAPDPARYAGLYVAARDAIVAVQPTVRVLVGGLWHPDGFLTAMLRARPDLVGHIDGVAVHPYGATPGDVLSHVRADRSLLQRVGLGSVPLYVTEVGWTTSPPGALDYLPEAKRPGYLAATLNGLGHLSCGVAAVLVYTWVTAEQDPHDSQQWFGIHPPRAGPAPDAAAFAAGLKAARGAGASTPCITR